LDGVRRCPPIPPLLLSASGLVHLHLSYFTWDSGHLLVHVDQTPDIYSPISCFIFSAFFPRSNKPTSTPGDTHCPPFPLPVSV
jgi:hypothetical protein